MRRTLKEIRLNKNLLQKDIVKKCNISSTFYSLVEAGQRNPSMKTAKKIAGVLDITLDEFYEALEYRKEGH